MVRVAVIGCGVLGVKIAGEFAYHGHRVKCYDNNVQALNSVYTRYQADKNQLYAEQLVESPNFAGQVLCFSRLEETVNDVQLVVECAFEDYDVKSVLLEKISQLCPVECIISTCTLRLDLAKLAEKIKHKERFVGLRFLYPVYYISEVEITPYKETSNWVIEKLRNYLAQMGKTLFFRSGPEPLILSEEKREMRKQQRIEELRNSSGLLLPNGGGHDVELSRTPHTDVHRLFMRRNQQQSSAHDYFSPLNAAQTVANFAAIHQSNSGGVLLEPHDTLRNRLVRQQQLKMLQEQMSSAAAAASAGGVAGSSAGGLQETDCAICMDKLRNAVMRPCNHMIACYECSMILLNRQDNCPVCREKIDDVIRIFLS